MKISSKNYPGSHAILLFFTLSGVLTFFRCGALIPAARPGDHRNATLSFEERRNAVQQYRSISAKGSAVLNTPTRNSTLPIEIEFRGPDTLLVLVRDPLGRKQALLNIIRDSYELQLLRKRQSYSADELPEEYRQYAFNAIDLPSLRLSLLGLTICNPPTESRPSRKPVVSDQDLIHWNCPVPTGELHYAIDQKQNRIRTISVLDSAGMLQAEIIFEEYNTESGLVLPSSISIRSGTDQSTLRIQLSHFSAELRKFA